MGCNGKSLTTLTALTKPPECKFPTLIVEYLHNSLKLQCFLICAMLAMADSDQAGGNPMDIERLFAAQVFAARTSDEIDLALIDLWDFAPALAGEISRRYVEWDANDGPRKRSSAGENVVS